MKLSIVIVNYNVEYFLEQCLRSVEVALRGIDAEVFVVDNNSVDGSVEMLKAKFPQVKLIANKDNPGFAKANNQAIRQCSGEYVLLLNPDTVVEEKTFSTALNFMDQHPEAGSLGIKMIDGKGRYLPESKRGMPTPWTAFYKIAGLSTLFPRSKIFARYYLGHLSEDKNQEIEILAGAFMLLRREALDKVGLLDEDYFMYGEDIDLSYRILKGGYKNYYLADSSIIHYKGESTKKGSLNYVLIFYRAMIIFAQKHFSGRYAGIFSFFINLAIYLRAALSVIKRVVTTLSVPLVDIAFAGGGLLYITEYWEANHRFVRGGEYPDQYLMVAFPVYIALWLFGVLISGGYKRPTRIAKILRGVALGTVAILVGYSLLPEDYRFSRAIIVLGSIWTAISWPLWRWITSRLLGVSLIDTLQSDKRILIVGAKEEAERVARLVKQVSGDISFTGYIAPDKIDIEGSFYTGSVDQLEELVRVFEIDEVIFCSANLSSQKIFELMTRLQPLKPEIKIAPSESQFIIGSNSIQNQGEWYAVQFNTISKPANRRLKRALDIVLSIIFALGYPLLAPLQRSPGKFARNIGNVLRGLKTWVGFDSQTEVTHLPNIQPGVLAITSRIHSTNLDAQAINQMNELYARDYQPRTDLNVLWRNWRELGK